MTSNGIKLTDVDTNIMNDDQFTYAQVLLTKGYAQRIVDELKIKAKKLTLTITDLTISDSVNAVYGMVLANGKPIRNDEALSTITALLEEVTDYLILINDVGEDEELELDMVIEMSIERKESVSYLSEISIDVEYLNQDDDEDEEDSDDEDEDNSDDEDEEDSDEEEEELIVTRKNKASR